jgi:hypothetical protein
MALRAKKPQAVNKRLKLFMFSLAGVGKTTAAIQFPNAYIIDAERGTENYDQLITASGGVVLQTNNMDEVITEVKSLLAEKHRYTTLVIDPITVLYDDLLEKCEQKVGSEFGRHYGEANKYMKRLANLIMALDMNVIVTAHAKKEYGENLKVTGNTFDGWKKLDYMFDLVVELQKRGSGPSAQRKGRVQKTRIEAFPDGEVFDWSYDEIKNRYGADILERPAVAVQLASPQQVREIKELLDVVRLPEGTTDKWFDKSGVDVWEDMPAGTIAKCIEYVRSRLNSAPSSVAAIEEPVGV